MENLENEIRRLKLENKRLIASQTHLGTITNDYLMLYYLTKSVNEAKSTKDLWTRYLKNITSDGFEYKNAFVLIKEKTASFDTKLFIEDSSLSKEYINPNDFDCFIKQALDKKETSNSLENTKSAIPIINMRKDTTAILIVESDNAISFEEIQLLEIYAKQTVTTIENIILNEKLISNQSLLGEKLDQFVMLHYISKDIHDSIKFHEVLEKYLISLTSALGFNFPKASIYLIKDGIKKVFLENSTLKFLALKDFDAPLLLDAFNEKTHTFDKSEKKLVIPLISINKNISALMYIESDCVIDFEKVQMLEIFAMQTSTMLQNTYLNLNLEEEVSLRTNELQRAYTELEQLDIMKDKFLSMVSHELRTPITSILAFLETILSSIEAGELDNETETDFLNIIFQDSQRLKLIVDDIIELSKLEGNAVKFNLSSINLNQALNEVSETFDLDARKKDLVIIKKLNLEPLELNLDNEKLKKIISSVLSNAIKFSPNNKDIVISSYAKNNIIGFSIKDKGLGIPIDEQNKVFSKFEQVDSIHHHSSGTGLGLPISKLLVEKMNGTLYFKSKENEGSTFYIEFQVN